MGSNTSLAQAITKYALRISIATALIAVVWCLYSPPAALADTPITNAAFKLLPDRVGTFKASAPAIGVIDDTIPQIFLGHLARNYISENGSRYEIQLKTTGADSEAFALLTRARSLLSESSLLEFNDVGTASFKTNDGVFFFKGTAFVFVHAQGKGSSGQVVSLARSLAQTLHAGDGDIPVLVKHLPDWETASHRANYFLSVGQLGAAIYLPGERPTGLDLKKAVKQTSAPRPQPVFEALDFQGGAEAVSATYGSSQLIIVEFTTPQFAGENDRRIIAKIQELKSQNQPTPSAYRRVGNYSVFVFNAADEQTANQLIDRVKYEQVVQWLGDNPHWYERAQAYILRTTGGVVVAVVEGSILALLVCLAIGTLIGTMLFRRRRAQQQAAAAYSDAGGAVRLNLDELTANRNRHRLLESGKERQSD